MSTQNVVLVREGDAYRALLQSLSDDFRRGMVVPLLGAGISCDPPSSLPLAVHLVRPLMETLNDALEYAVEKIHPKESDSEMARRNLGASRLERLLDALHQTHGSIAIEYLSVLNSREWNVHHGTYAALAASHLLESCITLNFDLLIEEAVSSRNVSCETECPLVGQRFVTGRGRPPLHLLKPHGSLAPSAAADDTFGLLSATLSQVGQRPAAMNVRRFRDVFEQHPVLLVAGYSDDDWDIFPILCRLRSTLKRVVWVEYAPDEEEAKSILLRVSDADQRGPLYERVIPWLRNGVGETTLLVGRVDYFHQDLAQLLNIEIQTTSTTSTAPMIPDATELKGRRDAFDERFVKTLCSLAWLLEGTGDFNRELLSLLRGNPVVNRLPHLTATVQNLLGHTEHTRGNLQAACRHTKRVIELKRAANEDVANEVVWLGYEYLCRTKRPNPLRPWELLLWPFFLLKGFRLLRTGVRLARPADRDQLATLADFYRVDLIHCWANLPMVFGNRVVRLLRPVFASIARRYDRIAAKSDLLEAEYYWMRHLEAKLFAGASIDRTSTDYMLQEIGRGYLIAQNSPQLGNALSYQALIAFLLDHSYLLACERLSQAEHALSEAGSDLCSGQRRVVLFRRFIGDIGFIETVRQMLRLERAIAIRPAAGAEGPSTLRTD